MYKSQLLNIEEELKEEDSHIEEYAKDMST
jgi:hypothetical protein